jgi:hypothetical protein
MGVNYNPKIVTDGLVLALDADNPKSYPGSGSTWFDISGNGRNYSIGSGISWNSTGYFSVAGGTFTGPASNLFNFGSTNNHTIEVYARTTQTTYNDFFRWRASPSVGVDTRAIQTHLYYSNGRTYYDISGCCATNQRIDYPNDASLTTGIRHLVWRTRTNQTPNRQFFKNLVSQVDSGVNSTATVTWNRTDAATIGNGWRGNLYTFYVYNRALSDNELKQNFNALRGRYGI